MQHVEAVIFDLGNVLVFHDNALLARRLGERAGLTEQEVGRRLTNPDLFAGTNRGLLDGDGIRREVCRLLAVEIDQEEFETLWSCHFAVNQPIQPLIESLVGRVKLLLLSNTNVLHTDFLRPNLPVLERFDHLLFSHDLGLVKPEPAFYEAALARAGVAPEAAVFFDDMPEFVEAARALGIRGHVFRDTDEFAQQLRDMSLLPGD
jgi:glucose-1-phosphatase